MIFRTAKASLLSLMLLQPSPIINIGMFMVVSLINAECYDSYNKTIVDCQCHASCSACGYSPSPTSLADCITCKDNTATVTQIYSADGTGYCRSTEPPSKPGCYDLSGTRIPQCQCHESCSACGYNDDPKFAVDCITCADSNIAVTQIYSDGTGYCRSPDPPGETGCYDLSGTAIDGCQCHESCSACGYNDNPIFLTDCITCADGSASVQDNGDGTGTCGTFAPSKPGCYDLSGTTIAGCQCHASCSACGYSPSPTAPEDCITCADSNSTVILVFPDGTGSCGTQESPSEEPSGCYDLSRTPVEDCQCHASCSACGYLENPNSYVNCIACADDGSQVIPIFPDGTGRCGTNETPTEPGCYDFSRTPIPDCQCHESCSACGYTDFPTSSVDCISCADSKTRLIPIFPDGTGRCSELPSEPGCYNSTWHGIADCQCHESCSACGYKDDPISMVDCISCADNTTSVTQVFPDGTGYCGRLEPGCYDYNQNVIPDCTCAPACQACVYIGIPDSMDYDCLACADSTITITPISDSGSGYCGSSQDYPCIRQHQALYDCILSVETSCPETFEFFMSGESALTCTDAFIERSCKIAKGEECPTCATQMNEFLQCAPTMTDEQVKRELGWENGLCWDSTVCGFSSVGGRTKSAAGLKFGSLYLLPVLSLVLLPFP